MTGREFRYGESINYRGREKKKIITVQGEVKERKKNINYKQRVGRKRNINYREREGGKRKILRKRDRREKEKIINYKQRVGNKILMKERERRKILITEREREGEKKILRGK